MSKGSTDHVKDQSKTGRTGHDGSDGSSPTDRVKRYGKCGYYCTGKNIYYGNSQGIRIVLSLLVDDGVPSRGHRKNIFTSDYRVMGVANGVGHPKYEHMSVMNYGGAYFEQDFLLKMLIHHHYELAFKKMAGI